MSFLENRHPEHEAKSERWDYAWKHYTGEYADKDHIVDFLHKKEQAETEVAYEERQNVTDPQLFFPTAVDSLNGILFSKSKDTKREWGALGDPEQPGSTAHHLLHNADGKGTNWQPLMKQVAIKQTVLHKVWGLVDGIKEVEAGEDSEGNPVTESVGEAKVRIIDPSSVVDWWPSVGMPEEVLVKETTDTRRSLRDEDGESTQETYILYDLNGWTRYRQTEDGEEVIGQDTYDFYSDTDRKDRILPIFPIEIPMPRDLGYLLALKQNHIFNFKSIRDFSVRNMSFAFLQLVADKEQYDEIITEVKKGFRVLRKDPDANGDHEYKSPSSDYLTEAGNILEKDKEAFMESAFRSYGDAARQVTATEIRQESRSGVEAFLTLLVSSLDEFENHCLFLLEQIYFPEEPGKWGQASVKRSDEFQPEDINEVFEKNSTAVRNADQAGAISTYEKVRRLNPGWTEEDIEVEVGRINDERNSDIPDPFVGDGVGA